MVFLQEVVWEGGVEEAVDVDVLIDEEIIPFVVFASKRVNRLCSASGRWRRHTHMGFLIFSNSLGSLRYCSLDL